MRALVVVLAVVGCGADCEPFNASQPGLSCESIDICCAGDDCYYVTEDGTEYGCAAPGNCAQAATDVTCDVCDIGDETAAFVGC